MSQSIINKHLDNMIYKLKKITNCKIDTIYVFYGRKEKETTEDKLIKQIFTDKEYDDIKEYNSKIVFNTFL